jgi:hypothetical protein
VTKVIFLDEEAARTCHLNPSGRANARHTGRLVQDRGGAIKVLIVSRSAATMLFVDRGRCLAAIIVKGR